MRRRFTDLPPQKRKEYLLRKVPLAIAVFEGQVKLETPPHGPLRGWRRRGWGWGHAALSLRFALLPHLLCARQVALCLIYVAKAADTVHFDRDDFLCKHEV